MEWDTRLDLRGAKFVPASAQPGQEYWALVEAKWLDEQESGGRHHIFMEPQDLMCRVWNGGTHFATKDFPMYSAGTPYSIQPETGIPADAVHGLGLGSIEQPDYKIHTSYRFKWRKTTKSTLGEELFIPIVTTTPIVQPAPASTYIQGLHDAHDPSLHAGYPGWCIVSIHTRNDNADYWNPRIKTMVDSGIKVIVRLNWGYSPEGTIPTHSKYTEFSRLCEQWVRNLPSDIEMYIIGNEPNLAIERPYNFVIIHPENYAQCFRECREEMQKHPGVRVAPAAIGPWNIETGDWLKYQADVLNLIGPDGCDGIAIHAYSRGYSQEDVWSIVKMNPPYASRYAGFYTYRDTMSAIPKSMKHLPVYMTECNGNGAWPNECDPWMRAVAGEIQTWNNDPNNQPIQCVCFYRAEYDDGFKLTSGALASFTNLSRMAIPSPDTKAPPPPPQLSLTHPIADPRLRRVTQYYGENPEAYAQYGLMGHNGVDFGVPMATPIRACDSGKVAQVLEDPGYGKYVRLIHTWGQSLYAHLSFFTVREGEKVQAGQTIGLSGNSGNSTGPHLHFAIRINPFDLNDGMRGYSDPLPHLPKVGNTENVNDLLARLITAEAGGEPVLGQLAVAHVVRNRVIKGGWWGNSWTEVINSPNQFAKPSTVATESAKAVADLVLQGWTVDVVDGATHFHNLSVHPAWADKLTFVKQIGNHRFYR